MSTVSLLTSTENGGAILGPVLLLLSGAVAAAGLACLMLMNRGARSVLPAVFAAVTLVWTLSSVGLVLTAGGSLSDHISHAFGYYGMLLGLGVALLGSAITFARASQGR